MISCSGVIVFLNLNCELPQLDWANLIIIIIIITIIISL